MENEIKERKEREYFIIHINYSTNRYYIYMYHRFRKFTINQAWDYINNDDNCILFNIECSGDIDNKNEEQILDQIHNLYFEPREEKNPLKRTVILRTITVSDEEGNDIKKEYPAEIKSDMEFEEHINKILNGEAQEDINDSAAIQQEQSDSEKELIKEDFVKFEEILKQNKFIDCYFEGKVKLTSDFVNECSGPSIIHLIYNFFPSAFVEHEEENCSIKVETRLGTIFILKPLDCPDIDCLEQYRKEHYYDVSLCIF